MANRASPSGIAAQERHKVLSKYKEEDSHHVLEYLRYMIGEDFDTNGNMDNFIRQLRNGVKLCQLMNALQPNIIRKINIQGSDFKLMENIGQFTTAAIKFGVENNELFQTVDLWEGRNPHQVMCTIVAVGRKAMSKGLPGIGPKEAQENKREFTEEQLRAGDTVIGLQAGNNKGANQSGMNFGNYRHL